MAVWPGIEIPFRPPDGLDVPSSTSWSAIPSSLLLYSHTVHATTSKHWIVTASTDPEYQL